VNGLYGVESSETGFIGPYESGELFGAAGVFLFVLAIGVFITMTMRTAPSTPPSPVRAGGSPAAASRCWSS
jgi:hypothetical protein